MTILATLIPNKHVLFSTSLLAVAGLVRILLLSKAQTIDELWIEINHQSKNSLIKPTFTQVVLATDLLFAIGVVELNEWSKLQNISSIKQGLD